MWHEQDHHHRHYKKKPKSAARKATTTRQLIVDTWIGLCREVECIFVPYFDQILNRTLICVNEKEIGLFYC